jgi:uncharacterized protein (TIGR03067 family)
MNKAVALVLVLPFLLIANIRADETKGPPQKSPVGLLGTWRVVAGEKEGKKEPPERAEGTIVRITEDTITVSDKNKKKTYVATYKIDSSVKPWAVTMVGTEGSTKGEKALGILSLEGDDLKLCYALAGEARPKDFATKTSKELLFTMRRIQP